MKKTHENKLSMYLAVDEVCNANAPVWTGTAGCSNAVNEFKSILTQITETRQIQESSNSGVTADKQARKLIMINSAMIVKGAVQAYATDINNNELYESVDYSSSAIKRKADTISRDRALLIYNKAMAISTELSGYGVSSTMLTDFQTTITDYSNIMARPRMAISSVKASTTQLDQLFRDADLILKRKIDKLMIQFKTSNVAFYNTFVNARQIVDSGKGSKTLEVKLKPEEAITVQRVINGSTLTNTGTSTLRYCADRLPPCDGGDDEVLLLAGQSITVDIKQPFVTLTNVDASIKGSFKVKVTSVVKVAELV